MSKLEIKNLRKEKRSNISLIYQNITLFICSIFFFSPFQKRPSSFFSNFLFVISKIVNIKKYFDSFNIF